MFISGCIGSSLLHVGFLWLRPVGATLRCRARASQCRGFSCCGARALCVQASAVVARRLSSCGSRALERRLSSCGLVAPRHVGPSQTKAWTRVPCTGRRILNHCATREAPDYICFSEWYNLILKCLYWKDTRKFSILT